MQELIDAENANIGNFGINQFVPTLAFLNYKKNSNSTPVPEKKMIYMKAYCDSVGVIKPS